MPHPRTERPQREDVRQRGSGGSADAAAREPSEGGLSRRARVVLGLSFLSVLGATYAILISGAPPLGVRAGELAPRDFKALSSFRCVDPEATRAARELARRSAPLVFRSARGQFESAAAAFLEAVEEGPGSALWNRLEDAELRARLGEVLPALKRRRRQLQAALERLGLMPLVSPSEWGENAPRQPERLLLYGEPQGEPRTLLRWEVVPLSPVSAGLGSALEPVLEDLTGQQRADVLALVAAFLRPTMVLDRQETAARAEAAARAQKPLMKTVHRGDVLLRKGTEVRQHDVELLELDRAIYARSPEGRRVRAQRLAGLAVLLLVLGWAGGFYIVRYRPELLRNRLQRFSLALLTLMLAAAARVFVLLDVPILLAPVPLVVMVLCLVYDQRFGFEAAALYGLLVGMAEGGSGTQFVALMVGGMMAALLTGHVRARTALLKAGLLAGVAQWAAVWGLGLLASGAEGGVPARFWESPLLAQSLCALGNGVISGFLVSGLLPVIERLFGVTTDIRLLEWSDPNQPLLQRLLVEAPGTYHHSMLVGSLAAEAAEAVGANPLLARVSAYFHDIGKLKKPQYFGENLEKDQKNPHDDLSPTMSRLIITAHPRDGAEMAQRYGFPKEVRDIILESHGSTTTRYFWDMAKRRGGASGELAESDFRYKLPKPHSKEAACVMLADAAESAARSLDSPTPTRIAELVRSIILDRLNDRQLDESGLTITDLDRIERALVRGLNAVYHSRVRYPAQDDAQAAGGAKQDGEAAHRTGEPPGQAGLRSG